MLDIIDEKMIGPLIQGFLMVGVIYWYSKGMLSLINDYYRDEFKDYIEKDPKKNLYLKTKEPDDSPLSTTHIDLNSPTIEGLSDLFNSEENVNTRSGIISRGVDKSPNIEEPLISSLNEANQVNFNGKLKHIEKIPCKIILEDDKQTCPTSKVLLNSNKFNYDTVSLHGDSQLNEKPILKSSVENKLNYEQITNRQALNSIIIDDDKSITEIESISGWIQEKNIDSTGNCFDSGGCYKKKASLQELREISFADDEEQQKNFEIKDTLISKAACRRKSVPEMIEFWTNFEQKLNENY